MFAGPRPGYLAQQTMSSSAKEKLNRKLSARALGGSAELLLQATATILSERSDLDVSFSEIEKRSGLNSALIKYYFGNKDGLLLALLERDAKLEMRALKHLVKMDLPADEKLRIHIKGILNNFHKSPYLNRLIHYMIENGSGKSGHLLKKIYISPMLEAYRKIVAQGVEEGRFRPVDAALLYCSLVGACDYIFSSINIPEIFEETEITEELKQRYIAHMVDLTLSGVMK
jgi:TetR/AcrR family transcriptional regulator